MQHVFPFQTGDSMFDYFDYFGSIDYTNLAQQFQNSWPSTEDGSPNDQSLCLIKTEKMNLDFNDVGPACLASTYNSNENITDKDCWTASQTGSGVESSSVSIISNSVCENLATREGIWNFFQEAATGELLCVNLERRDTGKRNLKSLKRK